MDILVTEQWAGAAAPVITELRRRGHRTWTCAAPAGSTARCAGVAGGRCPIDRAAVVVDVRTGASPPTPYQETALFCASAANRPVVTVGPPAARAPVDWAVAGCEPAELPAVVADVVELSRDSAGVSLPRLLRQLLRPVGFVSPLDVRMTPARDHVTVSLGLRAPLPASVLDRLTLAVRLALREHPWGPTATVEVRTDTRPP